MYSFTKQYSCLHTFNYIVYAKILLSALPTSNAIKISTYQKGIYQNINKDFDIKINKEYIKIFDFVQRSYYLKFMKFVFFDIMFLTYTSICWF